MKQWKGYILIISSMLIWGSAGIFGRLTGEPSTVIVFYRVITAFLALVLFWIVQGCDGLGKLKANWKIGLGSGIALGLNWYFFFAAVQQTTVANAVLSYYTTPIFVTILSTILLKERVEKRTFYALILGFSGLLIMVFGTTGRLGSADLLGIGFGITAALFYAILTIMGKLVDLPAKFFVLVQTAVATLIFLPYALNRPFPTGQSLFFLVIMGLVHTALALTMYFNGIKFVKVQHVGILGYLDPVSAILFALVFLGEIPGVNSFFGGGLILVSSYLVLRRVG